MLFLESLVSISNASGFWWNMGFIIVFGMIAGVKLDDGLRGFSRSLAVLTPYLFILIFTTALRIHEIGQTQLLGFNAFNGIATILATTFFYVIGLYMGHVIFEKAMTDALQKSSSVDSFDFIGSNREISA